MPFGGEALGHRGFALGLLVEAMATLVPGENTSDSSRVGNNLAFVVVRVDALAGAPTKWPTTSSAPLRGATSG